MTIIDSFDKVFYITTKPLHYSKAAHRKGFSCVVLNPRCARRRSRSGAVHSRHDTGILPLDYCQASRGARHSTHHGLDSPLEALILDLLFPRCTARDARPATKMERKCRIVCLEVVLPPGGRYATPRTRPLLKRPALRILRGVACGHIHGQGHQPGHRICRSLRRSMVTRFRGCLSRWRRWPAGDAFGRVGGGRCGNVDA